MTRTTGANPALSFTSTPAVNSEIVAIIAHDTSDVPSSVTDNKGNTYTERQSVPVGGGSGTVVIYTAKAATSSGTFTITFNGMASGFGKQIVIEEWAGTDTASGDSFDAVSADATGTSTSPSASATAVAANVTVIGVVTHYGADTTISQSDTLDLEEEDADAGMPIGVQYRVGAAGGGSVSSSQTFGASRPWAAITLTLAEAGGGGTTTRRYSLSLTGVG